MPQKFSYLTRPAKWVERLIFLEALSRLSVIVDFAGHRYVGFGALEFIDFRLIHNAFAISDMTSIERNTNEKDRYLANRPLACIDIEFGHSADVLPMLELQDKPGIVWLDYTQPLSLERLSEVTDTAMRLLPSSVLAVTFNCDPGPAEGRVERIQDRLGEDLPLAFANPLTKPSLARWGLAQLQSAILRHQVSDACQPATRVRTFLDVSYDDDARMQTLAWIVEDPNSSYELEELDWSRFSFVNDALLGDGPSTLDLPLVTPLERAKLDQELPNGTPANAGNQFGLDQGVVDDYCEVYRWYPRYVTARIAG